jgi:hypothetical protein
MMEAAPNQSTMRSVTAVFYVNPTAKQALNELSIKGLDTHAISLITSDASLGPWDKAAFLLIPAFGPLIVVGPIVAWIIDALEAPVLVEGLTALGAGLVSLGVPVDQARSYEWSIKAGRSLLVHIGTEKETQQLFELLRSLGPTSIDTQAVPPEPFTPAA